MWNYLKDDVEVAVRLVGGDIYEYSLSKKVGDMYYYDKFRKAGLTEAHLIRMVSEFNKEVAKHV